MKALIIFLAFALANYSLSAQTYYYVSALEVNPESPTTEDEVSVHVIGDFASTGSFITGHTIDIGAGTVDLTIDCEDFGGFAVITPFDTTFVIGTGLLAGDYTISLGGENLGDFVTDPNDYDFTVTGSSGVEEALEAAISWTVHGEQLLITNAWREPVGLRLYDIQGRALLKTQVLSPGTQDIELPDHNGVLLLSFELDGIVWGEKLVK